MFPCVFGSMFYERHLDREHEAEYTEEHEAEYAEEHSMGYEVAVEVFW